MGLCDVEERMAKRAQWLIGRVAGPGTHSAVSVTCHLFTSHLLPQPCGSMHGPGSVRVPGGPLGLQSRCIADVTAEQIKTSNRDSPSVASSVAFPVGIDPRLVYVISHWRDLPETTVVRIMSMVGASCGGVEASK